MSEPIRMGRVDHTGDIALPDEVVDITLLYQARAETKRLRALLAELVEWADRHGKEPRWLEHVRAALEGE